MRDAEALAVDDVRRDADDGPVDRRVHVGARRRADVERRVGAPPPSWYQRGLPPPPPKSLWNEPRSDALVRLPAERLSSASAPSVAEWKPIAVNADLRDRHPQTHEPCSATTCGNGGVCGLSGGVRRAGARCDRPAAAAEGGQRATRSRATIASSDEERERRARPRAHLPTLHAPRSGLGREDGMSRGTVANAEPPSTRVAASGSIQRAPPRTRGRSSQPRRRSRRARRYHRFRWRGRPTGPPQIEIPRWIQLVGLPLLLLLALGGRGGGRVMPSSSSSCAADRAPPRPARPGRWRRADPARVRSRDRVPELRRR